VKRNLVIAALLSGLASASALSAQETPELRPVVGRIGTDLIGAEDTLLDLAHRHRLGFQAVERLNPEIDAWIPVPGTVALLPTRFVLPHADEAGLVVNVPEMRLFDFTVEGGPEVFAVAIGDQADPSILGEFELGNKRKDPVWHVPASIRQERPSLPPEVPPGPENPLGSRWMTIGRTSYGIHGTNVRWSIGREATHGCLRLYDDEVQRLYERVRPGTRIQIVYQPYKWGREGGRIYLEAHPDLYGLMPDRLRAFEVPRALGLLGAIDLELAWSTLEQARGIPVAVGTLPAPAATSTPSS
jgi:L,D-transpeptidase ErfK/SrfK